MASGQDILKRRNELPVDWKPSPLDRLAADSWLEHRVAVPAEGKGLADRRVIVPGPDRAHRAGQVAISEKLWSGSS
jgi:hypothetical protein